MNYKKVAVIFIFLHVFQWVAAAPEIWAKEQQPKIAVVYMTDDDLPNENIYLWEATFSAFAEDIELVAANQVDETTLHNKDVTVFIGDERGVVPLGFQESIKAFEGRIIAFGYNAEQLTPYAEWHFTEGEMIRTLNEHSLPAALSIIHAVPPNEHKMLSVGQTLNEQIPFIVQQGLNTYIASTSIGTAEKIAVSGSIYEMLNIEPPKTHPAYIQLKDISPITDSKLVKEAGDYLVGRNIPFYMAVTPVYVDSKTGVQTLLAENEALVQTLQDLQSRGGMVIAHGYTNTYHSDEAEEGFEFWDVKFNQKITTIHPDKPSFSLKSESTFPTREAYEIYMNEIDWVEKQYIDQKQTKSIEQLVDIGLYPIAFEAPNYAMSSSGYRVTSNYFSSVFGQVQLSDDNWEVMNTPLFTSTPAITSGMTLYPETIGFVDLALSDPLEEMKASIEQLKTVPGSMMGGFYHPYIGMDHLPEMIALMESVGNIEWLDLRGTSQIVKTNHVTIEQEAGASLQVSTTITRMNRFFRQLKDTPFEASLWIMAIVVTLFIFAFFIYISRLRIRLRKRLFEEREQIG